MVVYLRCLSQPFAYPASPLARAHEHKRRFVYLRHVGGGPPDAGSLPARAKARHRAIASARRDELPSSKLFLTTADAFTNRLGDGIIPYRVLDARTCDLPISLPPLRQVVSFFIINSRNVIRVDRSQGTKKEDGRAFIDVLEL